MNEMVKVEKEHKDEAIKALAAQVRALEENFKKNDNAYGQFEGEVRDELDKMQEESRKVSEIKKPYSIYIM